MHQGKTIARDPGAPHPGPAVARALIARDPGAPHPGPAVARASFMLSSSACFRFTFWSGSILVGVSHCSTQCSFIQ